MRDPRGGRASRLSLVAVLALAPGDVLAQEPAAAFVIVVSPDVTGTTITRGLLKQIFLKEVQRWGDERKIAVVDQSLRSPVRESFSREVLEQTPQRVLLYWQQRIRSGLRPPRVLESDADVLDYVGSHPGAIGYVTASAEPDDGSVKVLTIAADPS